MPGPGAVELCNAVDDDCDGEVDEGALDARVWYGDADGDGDGDPDTWVLACEAPLGHVGTAADCDDTDPSVSLDGEDLPDDGVDQDCSGADAVRCFADADGDGFGFGEALIREGQCAAGEVLARGDCDDADAGVHPGGVELPDDGVDQDCSGADTVSCWPDGDQDGFGYGDVQLAEGACGALQAPVDGDCHPADPAVYPGADDLPMDGIDQDCSGADVALCFEDLDGDGFGGGDGDLEDAPCDAPRIPRGGDCDDTLASVHPGGAELVDDGVDQDCSGADTIRCYTDVDGDGFGDALAGLAEGVCGAGLAAVTGDCNDLDGATWPGAPEVADDGVDQDCTGLDLVTCHVDDDGDGYGGAGVVTTAEVCPSGAVADATDCNDGAASIHPEARDRCDGGIDNDCDPSTPDSGTRIGSASYSTLAMALRNMADGDTIEVCSGVYSDTPYVIDHDVTLVAVDGPGTVTLDGSGASDPVVEILWSDVTLEGFDITGGSGLYWSGVTSGGGLYIDSAGTVRLEDCDIYGNDAVFGGGLFAWDFFSNGGILELVRTSVHDNTAWAGGGMYALTRIEVDDADVSDNFADEMGGGMVLSGLDGSQRVVVNSGYLDVDRNVSGEWGGGVVAFDDVRMGNGMRIRDSQARWGGGLYVDSGEAAVVLTDVELVRNTAELGGAGYIDGRVLLNSSGVEDNEAEEGGGFYVAAGSMTADGGSIARNTATVHGGGVLLQGDEFSADGTMDWGAYADNNEPDDVRVNGVGYRFIHWVPILCNASTCVEL